jgi:hypothetical protein
MPPQGRFPQSCRSLASIDRHRSALVTKEGKVDRFFAWVGRINSVLLLLFLIGAAIQIAVWNWPRGDRSYPQHAAGAAPSLPAQSFSFARTERVIGSDTFLIRLTSMVGTRDPTAMNRYGDEMRNVLFLSDGGQRTSWLFDTHANLLLVVDQLRTVDRVVLVRTSQREFAELGGDEPTKALYFEFASVDTNKDGKISREDDISVGLAKPDGSGFSAVLGGVTRVLSHATIGENGLAVMYQSREQLWYALFRLDTFQRLAEHPIAAP